MSRRIDPEEAREAVQAVGPWLFDADAPHPDRAALASAVRLTARTLTVSAPGASVEVRVPPFVAVQCISGPRHTRGTPPNVVETDPRTWLLLAAGLMSFEQALGKGLLMVSGARAAEISPWFPLVSLSEGGAG